RPQTLTLEPGDSMVLVTDGAVEAADENGDELGGKGLQAALASAWGSEAAFVAELARETVHGWRFEQDNAGWEAAHHIESTQSQDGVMVIETNGSDPYLFSPLLEVPTTEAMSIRVRIRSEAGGDGQLFWATDDGPHFTESRSKRFTMEHDGKWHEYDVSIQPTGTTITRLRLDPAQAKGRIEVSHVTIDTVQLHPLEIERVQAEGDMFHAWVRYHGEGEQRVTMASHFKSGPSQVQQQHRKTLNSGEVWRATFEIDDASWGRDGKAPVARFDVEASTAGVEPVGRRVRLHRENAATPDNWKAIRNDTLTVRLHPRGLFARIYREGERVALIGPLVTLANGDSAGMDVQTQGDRATLIGDEASVTLRLEGAHLHATVEAEGEVEALVTRVLGDLEQGLLPGVEHLGAGEWSSSKADIETEEHVRFEPPRMHVTMPLLAVVTDRVSVAMLYNDLSENRPIFASPNFFDGTADHRMSVRGERIEAVLRFDAAWGEQRLEDLITWAYKTRGLAKVADRPRSTDEQFALSLHALHGVLRNDNGWGHCAEESWARNFYADHAGTIWRLTGEMPDVPELVRGGAHLPNDSAYFASGRAQQWLNQINGLAAHLRDIQREDGSYGYDGKYARTHFEDTASGHNGEHAATLLTHAWYTGNAESLAAGLKTLEYTKRFRTPRGAQVWEMPMHTPDVLAAARLVRAYVLAYRLTGDEDHLTEAKRWAISGLPFLYQWQMGDEAAMPWAVIAVYGATNWEAPNWIGLPVQWCGLPYADALLMLAEHDETFDWKHVAEGILVSAEWQM
ncbi:MAG: SpoIIE family protein phosphatase, partial [Phycisphaeraceae bacterium]